MSRSYRLQPVPSAEFAGRAAARLAKDSVEPTDRAEARRQGDAEDLVVRGGEQSLGVRDAGLGEVSDQRGAERALKDGHGVVRVQPDVVADVVDGQRLRVSHRDESRHSLDVAEVTLLHR